MSVSLFDGEEDGSRCFGSDDQVDAVFLGIAREESAKFANFVLRGEGDEGDEGDGGMSG